MRHITNNPYRIIPGIFLGLLMAGTLSSCSSSEAKEDAATKKQQSAAVPVFDLQKDKLSSSIRMPGELIAYQQVDIYAKVNSIVKKLYADVGTEVKQGQLIAVMEAPELSSQLAGAESRYKAQEAVYSASKANYDRLYETSKTPGTVSSNDLDQASARMRTDLAQYQAAKSAYKEIADTRNYLEIRAPFSGIISARNVNTGATVGPAGKGSELPIFTLQEQKKLRLAVSVPEAYTGYMAQGLEVSFTVKALPNEVFKAKVTRLAGALDTRLRSERVEMDVVNDSKRLLPGMISEVTLPIPARDSSFVVPKTAVVNSAEKIFVIRAENGNAKWVTVKKGLEADDKVEIFGALHAGDRIVTAGNEEIRDGAPVATTSK
ncbi:efflux RND transporter periplasmic adaptor subunit [Chitinophagaceae bacterium MMS25-I14]